MSLKKISVLVFGLCAFASQAFSSDAQSLFKTDGYVYQGTITSGDEENAKTLPISMQLTIAPAGNISVKSMTIQDKQIGAKNLKVLNDNSIEILNDDSYFGETKTFQAKMRLVHKNGKNEVFGRLLVTNISQSDKDFAKTLKDIHLISATATVQLKLYKIVTKLVLVK